MQKLTLMLAAALLCNFAAKAQKGVELGVQFTPMTTWILNNEDFDEGDALNFRGTFGYLVGMHAGYNITETFGIQTGFMFNKCGQNYITDYAVIAKADQNTFGRSLSYFRVPLLFKLQGTVENSGGMYFRIGPHFDFLNSARFRYDDKGGLDLDADVKLKDFVGLDPDAATFPLTLDTRKYQVYKKFVLGATLEMGGFVKLNDNMKMTFMLHLEGSLTNPEGKDAGALRVNALLYPNVGYPSTNLYERSTAWQVAGGLTVGWCYVIPVGE